MQYAGLRISDINGLQETRLSPTANNLTSCWTVPMANRALIGKETPIVLAEVRANETISFAKALGDLNPLYVEEEEARKSKYGGLLAPPTFPVTLASANMDPDLFFELDLNFASIVHGEQEFVYFRPLKVGEKVRIEGRVADIKEKQGSEGPLDLVVLETTGYDERGKEVYIARMTLVSRKTNLE